MNRTYYNLNILLITVLIFISNVSTLKAKDLIFCHRKSDSPWVVGGDKGQDITRINLLQSVLKIKIILTPLPWKRCISSLKSGKVDGLFSVDFQKDMFDKGVYPPDLDVDKGMHESNFMLYLRKGSKVTWDGRLIRNVDSPLGVEPGFSMKNRFELLSIPLDEINSSTWGMFKMLELNRLGGVIVQEQTGDRILKEFPYLKLTLMKHPISIARSPTYLMLSNKLVKTNPKLANRIWSSLKFLEK